MAVGTQTNRQADDRELLREYAVSRSTAAFEELVRRNAGLVYSAARRQVGDPQLAEDVAQGVFLVLARKASTVHGTVAGWLVGVTYNASRNAKRMAARRAYHERQAAIMKIDEAQPGPTSEWDEYAPAVDAAMNRLGRVDRDLIAMRYLRQASLKDVGASLGISEEAARKRVDRAMGRLRELVNQQTAAPAVAVFAAELLANGAQAAPAKLVESIAGSLASGAKRTAASTIASKTAHALALAKMKGAAAIVLTVGVVGIGAGTAIKMASDSNSPAPIAPAPLPAQSTTPIPPAPALTPESQIPGDIQLVRWGALLSDESVAAIRPLGKPVRSASMLYQTFVFNGNDLRRVLAANYPSRNVMPDPNWLEFTYQASPDQLMFSNFSDPLFMVNPQNSGIGFLTSIGTGGIDITRVGDRLHLKLDYRNLLLTAGAVTQRNDVHWGPGRSSSMQFDGQIAAGDALVFLSRLTTPNGRPVNFLAVFETFRFQTDEPFLNQIDCGWWIVHGPQALRQSAYTAYVWRQNTAPDKTHPASTAPITLEDGKTAELLGISRPSQWAGCWWDAAGNSTEPCNGLLMMQGDPPGGLWACVRVRGPTEENQVEQPVPSSRVPAEPFADWGSGKVAAGSPPLTVGVPVGPWKELARVRPGESAVVDGVTYRIPKKAAMGRDPIAIKIERQGRIDDFSQYIDYVAVGRDGKQVAAANRPPGIAVGKDQALNGVNNTPNFFGIDFGDVAYFRVVARKRQWVSFNQFATQPRITPAASVTDDQVNKAVALEPHLRDQAILDQIARDHAVWAAIPADPTNAKGAARLLANKIEQGNEQDVRQMIFSTNAQVVASLDRVAHYLVQSEANRQKLIQLFGQLAVRNQLQCFSDDVEEAFFEAPWKQNTDGTWQSDQLIMQIGADGKFQLKLDQLFANPQTLAMVKGLGTMQDQLAARLAKNPPPTIDEVKSLTQPAATTQPAN